MPKNLTQKILDAHLIEGELKAGEEIFIHQCYSCHTINGFNNDIVSRTAGMSFGAMSSYIKKIHKVRYFMPPFAGTDEEADALAAYIIAGLHGKEVVFEQQPAGGVDGAVLFENNCAACHAPEDLSPAFEEMELPGIREQLATLDQISDEMVPFEGSEEEAELLARFLFALNNEVANEPPEEIDGVMLFENNCSVCHANEDVAEFVSGWDRSTIREALDELETLSEEMPPYEGSNAEKEALANYLNSLKGE